MKTTVQWHNVYLLFIAQALFQTASILVITLSGMAGLVMAPRKNLATLPVAMITVGAAAMMIPASMIIRKTGQRKAFMIGTLTGCLAGLVSWYGIIQHSFWVFSIGNTLVGAYQGFSQYYRFAAADAVPGQAKSKAISLVIAGGIVAAFAGPNLAKFTQHIGTVPYAYSYFSIILLSLLALGIVSLLKLGKTTSNLLKDSTGGGRPLKEIIKNKDAILAVLASSTAFAVMGMSMTVTPIAMYGFGHPSEHSATVIQWHVLGMFLPSFFTGLLIQKFGVYRIIIAGLLMMLLYIALALSGTGTGNFIAALFVVGLGWNFLFIGGSSLLTKVYQPDEKEKTQAFHDFTVFAVISIASFFAGSLFNHWGWKGVNIVLLPMLVVTLIAAITITLRKSRSEQ
jgi:MFS family permease